MALRKHPRKTPKTTLQPIPRIPIPKLIFWGALIIAPVSALQFPDTTQLLKQYVVSKTTDGLPVTFISGIEDGLTVHVSWDKKKSISQISYQKSKGFTDGEFSKLAHTLGTGAVWHEVPMPRGDSSLLRTFPGLEQQWVLKGFQGETGWMGSGLHNSIFFLTFLKTSPRKQSTVEGPLKWQKNFVAGLKTSGDWVPATCRKGQSGTCYIHSSSRELQAKWNGKDASLYEIWVFSTRTIEDIEDALHALTPNDYSQYARELPYLSHSETQSVLVKLSQSLPGLFNWPSWQLQDIQVGLIGWGDYYEIFKSQGTDWPFIPIFKFDEGGQSLKIRLYFDGSYQLLFKIN